MSPSSIDNKMEKFLCIHSNSHPLVMKLLKEGCRRMEKNWNNFYITKRSLMSNIFPVSFFLSRSLFNWNGFIVLRCGKKLTCRFTFLFYFFPFAIPNHSHYSMPKAMYKLLWTRLALFCHHHLCAHTPESLTLKMKKLIPQRALDVASVPIFYGLKYDDLEHALLCHKIYIRNFILSKI